VRLLTGLFPDDDPLENRRAIARGELAKAKAEEPWLWHGSRCGCLPCTYWRQKTGGEA
jgi:hypothetical protein